jgi:hypothetical protein
MKKSGLFIALIVVMTIAYLAIQAQINPLNLIRKPVRTEEEIAMDDFLFKPAGY